MNHLFIFVQTFQVKKGLYYIKAATAYSYKTVITLYNIDYELIISSFLPMHHFTLALLCQLIFNQLSYGP